MYFQAPVTHVCVALGLIIIYADSGPPFTDW